MRTASEIIKSAGGPDVLAAKLDVPSRHTVAAWAHRESIPSQHWKRLSEIGAASLEELATVAAASNQQNTPKAQAA